MGLGLPQAARPCPHLEVKAGVLHHPLCQSGDVDAAVALPCEEEVVLGVLREEPQELLQRQVVVVCDLQGQQMASAGWHWASSSGLGLQQPHHSPQCRW